LPLTQVPVCRHARKHKIYTTSRDTTRRERSRHLALITGVPGAGKTLVGLQFVYQHHFGADPDVTNRAVFLSGNGPLVEVLQHALGRESRVFVQPMRNFIKEYGFGTGHPREHVLVFDEAQRAWDMDWVLKKHGHKASEPDLLIKAADRLPGWAMLVGLIGEGQEIHTGEEAGLTQWNEALLKSPEQWTVHTPPDLRRSFTVAGPVEVNPLLSLTFSLRTHLASDVQEWLRYLLMGEIDLAVPREGSGKGPNEPKQRSPAGPDHMHAAFNGLHSQFIALQSR